MCVLLESGYSAESFSERAGKGFKRGNWNGAAKGKKMGVKMLLEKVPKLTGINLYGQYSLF